MSSNPEELLLGRLALHYRLISEDQLAAATRQQAKEAVHRPLGDLFVELGYMSQQRMERLLAIQKEYQERRAETAAPPAPQPVERVVVPATGGAGRRVDRILEVAVRSGASDVHLHSGLPIRMRRCGALEVLGESALDARTVEQLLSELLDPAGQRSLAEQGQVDFAYAIADVARFRGNAYRTQRGSDAVLRLVPPVAPGLADLGMPQSLAGLTNFPQGLVLITGPAGCGKSATLAALLRVINEERREHIITIEDPVEILHRPVRSVVNQRQVGRDTGSFARALRAALREDPDVIAIGELRDLESISLALTAAETGHLVLATLHTGSAIRTLDRIIGVFPPSQQNQIRTMVADSLRAVVSQRLLNRADGRGRVPALEILVGTRAVGNLIRENKGVQLRSLMQTGAAQGMCLLDSSLAQLVRAGTVRREEALLHCEDPRAIPA